MNEDTAVPVTLLTEAEHEAVQTAGALAGMLSRVVGDGPNRTPDLNELLVHVHAIQHAVLAQAAARAYPDLYRLLASSLNNREVADELPV